VSIAISANPVVDRMRDATTAGRETRVLLKMNEPYTVPKSLAGLAL
jgi:hypothetical protein